MSGDSRPAGRTGGEQCSRPGREGGRPRWTMSDSAMSLSTPECSRPFSLSPVHNWPNCLTHSADLTTQAYLRGAAQATQDTHSYLLYNVTAKSDLTQVDRQTVARSVDSPKQEYTPQSPPVTAQGKTRGSQTRVFSKVTFAGTFIPLSDIAIFSSKSTE